MGWDAQGACPQPGPGHYSFQNCEAMNKPLKEKGEASSVCWRWGRPALAMPVGSLRPLAECPGARSTAELSCLPAFPQGNSGKS